MPFLPMYKDHLSCHQSWPVTWNVRHKIRVSRTNFVTHELNQTLFDTTFLLTSGEPAISGDQLLAIRDFQERRGKA